MNETQLQALQRQLTWYLIRADQELVTATNADLPMDLRRRAAARYQDFLIRAQEAVDKAAVHG